MYQKCPNITGLDISERSINIAKKNFPFINFINCSSDFLPSQKYDLVVLSHVLEHLDDPMRLLQNIKKISTLMYIEVPDFESSFLNHLRFDLGSDLIYSDNDHVREYTRDYLFFILKEENITVSDFESRHGSLKFWCSVN